MVLRPRRYAEGGVENKKNNFRLLDVDGLYRVKELIKKESYHWYNIM